MSQAPPRRLRTWSRFGQIRRVPSDYEILTHDLNYTMREGREAALESNPTTPANMWFLTYRDRSPLQADDWNGFRDPDELTYRKYVTLQDEQETVVEGILEEYTKVDHDARLEARWLKVLATVFTPMRYPTHALQMTQAYLGGFAPSSYITNAASFAAADLLRRVSLIAYRTRQLQLAHPEVGFATGEREIWEDHPDWQPARRALEAALIAYDWGECLSAVNLVLRPTLDEVLLRQLGLVADANGDQLTWLLLGNLALDSDRNARWSAALVRYAIGRRRENAAVLRRWVERWAPRADAAAAGLARMLAELPQVGRDASVVTAAASAARERVLADAGLAAQIG
ncbi:MAG TPA: toluene hydroxylase [Candidatus Dormibacteraeota bacterium]|nr:toluene hydroxylase [Candidatus Dormibacteraeota bacterium]